MSKKYYADIRITVTVSFEDDGETDLKDQAIEVAEGAMFFGDMDMEIIGKVRDTETPT